MIFAVIADNKEDLTNTLEKMSHTFKEYCMKIHKWKIKILTCSKQQIYENIILDGLLLETQYVSQYKPNKTTKERKIFLLHIQ